MNDDLERWIEQQEKLPEHLKRWLVFDRPRYIWLGRILMHVGFWSFGQRICGLRYETDEERADRLHQYWRREDGTTQC